MGNTGTDWHEPSDSHRAHAVAMDTFFPVCFVVDLEFDQQFGAARAPGDPRGADHTHTYPAAAASVIGRGAASAASDGIPSGIMTTHDDVTPLASPISGLRTTLEMVGLVIAPVTAISSVLLYFGWQRQNAVYGYFGVSPGMLKFSAQDYLLRSVGVIFKPLAVILGCAAAVLIASRVLNRLVLRTRRSPIPQGRRRRLSLVPALQVAVALLLLAGGLLALLGQWDALWGAFCLASGAVVVSGIARGHPADPRQVFWSRVLIGSVIAFAVFWAVTVYAVRSGTAYARYVDQYPTVQPSLTVHSATRLDFPEGLVTETRFPGEDGQVRYKYSGLRLLSYANDRWVVIVGREQGRARVTVSLLKDSDAIRIELTGH